jgi:hypothetical protein
VQERALIDFGLAGGSWPGLRINLRV